MVHWWTGVGRCGGRVVCWQMVLGMYLKLERRLGAVWGGEKLYHQGIFLVYDMW